MLKGKTIIELTDTKTGKVEKYEDNNLVTEAINDVILKRKKYMGFSTGQGIAFSETKSNFISMFPLYKRFFGGIMLFENTIDENRKFLNGNDKIVGSATFGNAYSGADQLVGSYNSTESEINNEEKYAKFVYDFATNQGNGTISAVALGNYHYIKHMMFGTDCNSNYVDSMLSDIIYAPYHSITETFNYDPAYVLFPTALKNTSDYEIPNSTNKYCYEIPILFDDEKGILITLEYCSSKGTITYSNVADTIRLHVYDIGVSNVTLLGTLSGSNHTRFTPREIFTKDFTVTPFGNYGVYNIETKYSRQGWYDKETGYAYLLGDTTDTSISQWTADKVMRLYKFNLNVQRYEDVTLETVEITNKTGKTINISTSWTSQSSGRRTWYIKNGYFYCICLSGYYPIFLAKINLKDSTDVSVYQITSNNSSYCYFSGFQGDFIYIYDSTAQNIKVFNTKTNELKYCRVKKGSQDHFGKPVPFKHTDMYNFVIGGQNSGNNRYTYWYGIQSSRNDYLATINNLDTPVTKTPDKTMKITYVLREG